MSNEPEYRDANPSTENLPGKGRVIIQCIAGGVALLALTIISMRIRPVGLAVGGMAFFYGIVMMARRHKFNFKISLIVTICGFFILLVNPRFGVVVGLVAFYILLAIALGFIIYGLVKAINLAWDLGKFS